MQQCKAEVVFQWSIISCIFNKFSIGYPYLSIFHKCGMNHAIYTI